MKLKTHKTYKEKDRAQPRANNLIIFNDILSGWHITLYILAAVFGILNYSFFTSTEQLFDNNCVLFPRKLVFHIVKLPNATFTNATITNDGIRTSENDNLKVNNTSNNTLINNVSLNNNSRIERRTRDVKEDEESDIDFKNSKLIFISIIIVLYQWV